MKSNVRNYADVDILNRIEKHVDGFTHFPKNKWGVGVRSTEDAYNKFDDKFYVFEGEKLLMVNSITTNAGSRGLKNFETYNEEGCAVFKSDVIVYDSHKLGMSKGRTVYRQDKSFPYYRDNNRNNYAEEIGRVHHGVIYAHIHDAKMGDKDEYKEFINGWSTACQVMNNGKEWNDFLKLMDGQEYITYCLLKEFEYSLD